MSQFSPDPFRSVHRYNFINFDYQMLKKDTFKQEALMGKYEGNAIELGKKSLRGSFLSVFNIIVTFWSPYFFQSH